MAIKKLKSPGYFGALSAEEGWIPRDLTKVLKNTIAIQIEYLIKDKPMKFHIYISHSVWLIAN